jgi:small subunit ribosomal protein S17
MLKTGRVLIGKVVSDKMIKSVVVKVRRFRQHKLYDITERYDRKFMAHDEDEMTKEGDEVRIELCRPLSKRKHYTVTRVLKPVDGGEPYDVTPVPPFPPSPPKTKTPSTKAKAYNWAKNQAAKLAEATGELPPPSSPVSSPASPPSMQSQ